MKLTIKNDSELTDMMNKLNENCTSISSQIRKDLYSFS